MYRYPSQLLKRVKRHIASGGIIAYPTESCFGLGCDPFNYKAVAKVIKLKGRSKAKGLIAIAGKEKQLGKLILPLNKEAKQELSQYWPGPFSIILPVTSKVPQNLIGKHEKIAVRVTRHKMVGQLCNYLNMPLVSTSANKSGCRSIRNYRDCKRIFGQSVFVLPGITNFAKRPSTIIDWQTKQVLR